jgi:hypothetical protein
LIRKKTYFIIFIIFFILAIFFAAALASGYVFFSMVFIGIWTCFTIKFFEKSKYARQFNSPHNTAFFVFGPLLVGLFFNFWSYYSPGVLGQNLLEDSIIYLSPWVLIFALPYLLYSLYIVYSCLAKFNLVYIGKKSFGSRKFGLIMTLFWIIWGLLSPLYFALVYQYLTLTPMRTYIDLITFILASISLILLVIYGVGGYHKPISEISRDYIAQRRTRLNRLQNTPERSTRTTMRTTPYSRSITSTQSSSRTTPLGSTHTVTRSSTKTTSRAKHKGISSDTKPKRTAKPKEIYNLSKLKPKAGALTIEDFKCIFCFRLPKLPDDQKREIVICPHCRHPAHIDEFNDWLRHSTLCSRCNQRIPENFMRKPEKVPVNVYLKAMEQLLKS